MLPFTKRSKRGDDDDDVVTKDDLVNPNVPSSRQREIPRATAPSANEDELTSIMSSRGPMSSALSSKKPVPAAGRPASIRPPATSSSRLMNQDADDEEDGRTVLRASAPVSIRESQRDLGAPRSKREKRETAPTSISPQATMKSDRRDRLMPGPPAELLDRDLPADMVAPSRTFEGPPSRAQNFAPASRAFEGPPSRKSALPPPMSSGSPFEGPPSRKSMLPPSMSSSSPIIVAPANSNRSSNPMIFEGPPSHRHFPPPASSARMSQKLMTATGGQHNEAFARSSAAAATNMNGAMPAHFASADPPATSISGTHRVGGRPGGSWAAAIVACALFVGVSGIALMQSSDSLAETSAAFVDPARAPSKAAAASSAAAPPPAAVPMTPNGTPVPAEQHTGGLIGASPLPPPPAPDPPPPPPVQMQPPPQPVAAAPQMMPGQPMMAPPQAAPTPIFQPVAVAPARPHVASGGNYHPSAPAAAPPRNDPPKSTGGRGGDVETRKALEALQKAQLESASSFGN